MADVVFLHKPSALLLSDKGAIQPCLHNACVLIADATEFANLHFDEFLSRLRMGERDWTDADDLELLRWLQSAHGVSRFTLGHARDAARSVAYSRKRDSLRVFVENLPEWDGTLRIDNAFAKAWGAPASPLSAAASRNFFIALIARAMQPGAQVDTVWCFEGAQGVGKSRSLRALGAAFHAEITAAIGSADFMRELRGLWIAELSELDSLRGREASTVKRLLSAPVDRLVEKYQVHAQAHPRRAVAVATTNEADYWADSTGARRLIPIRCGDIDVAVIEQDRLQWFAEALYLFNAGSTWWEFPDEITTAQEERQQIDPWEDAIRGFMQHGRATGSMDGASREPWPSGWIASADIMQRWLGLGAGQTAHQLGPRLGRVMRRLGYVPKSSKDGNERGWAHADTTDQA